MAIKGRTVAHYIMEVEIAAHVHEKRKGRNRGRPALYGGPTPQMRAKAEAAHGLEQVPVGAGHDPAHRLNSAIDDNRKRFDDYERKVAAKLTLDIERASSASVTPPYDGMPRSTSGPRHGGVPDAHREAHHRVALFESRIDPWFWRIAQWLIGKAQRIAGGYPISVQDLGRELSHYTGQDTSRAAGVMAIKAALRRVGEEYEREAALGGQEESISEMRARIQLRSERETAANARKRVFSGQK